MTPEQPKSQENSVRVVKFSSVEGGPPGGSRRATPDVVAEDATLASYLWTLLEGRWTVALIATAFVAAALAYLFVAVPIYRSAVTIQVEDKTKTLAGLEEISAMFGEKVPAETEIEILRSRTLIRGVVRDLGLDLQVSPRRFPVVGNNLAGRYRGRAPASAPIGLSRFGWGGERIQVRRLDVSDDLLDERLVLTALDGGRYRLADASGDLRIDGEVGKVGSVTDGQRRIELFVAELVARPGTQFKLTKRRRSDVIDQLIEELKVAEKGKKTGIIVMTLDGPDPVRTAAVLDAVSTSYLRQNVERKSAEAAKTLEFLESQLPILKSNLEAAQVSLNTFQVTRGTVDLSRETSSVLERSVEIEKALQDLELQRAELRQRFTENHPALTSLNEKAQKLRAERASLAAQMRGIPAAEGDSARLLRDVKSASELYTVLLNKAQELRVVKSGTIGNVRIIDQAVVADKPEYPKPRLVLLIAITLGLATGVAGVFLRKAFDQGAEDADEIEARVGLPVYVTVPHSDRQAVGSSGKARSVLAATDPADIAVENLRSLRTSLQFALVESRNSVVAISGPGLGVGKSFVCVNLAYILASPERRVLLVDCDLRRGRLHHYFNADRHPGVSDVISGTVEAAKAVHTTQNAHLDILSAGRIPPNPAELLASQAFEQLLTWASCRYGFVMIDTPPVLAVTDAAIVARLAGVNLLVLRAGQHPIREIVLTVKRLTHSGAKVQGTVLNDVPVVRGRYGKYGRYQSYEYRSNEAQ